MTNDFNSDILIVSLLDVGYKSIRGLSSAGRAPRWQRGGQGFDPPRLHIGKPLCDGGEISGKQKSKHHLKDRLKHSNQS